MYDFMGLDSTGIPEIQAALEAYKEGIDSPLSELASQVDYAAAFRGSTIADTMRSYIEAVIAELQKMTGYLDEFNNSLLKVQENYEAQVAAISGNIMADADNIEGIAVTTTHGVN